jgi:predicted permease
MLVYTICAAILIGAVILFGRTARMGLKDAAFGAVVGVYPNAGFMGIPLLVVLFGEVGVRVIILTMLVDLFLVISCCLAIVQMPEKQAGSGLMSGVLRGIGRAFAGALKGALSNPLLWPVAAGIAWGALGPALPAPVSKTLTMLADTASPVALFAIGAILARNAMTSTQATPVADYLPIALVKLLVHPACVYATGWSFMAIGVAFEAKSLAALTLVAALPPAINITMLAERFGADSGRIARIIMAATALSFFSLTAAVWLLGVGPSGS